MSYYTTVPRLYQVVPMVGSLSDVTSAVLSDAFINAAESVINSYLVKSYTVPLSLTGVGTGIWCPVLTTIATDLSLYRLLSQRIFTQEQLKNSTWPDRFKESMKTLEMLRDGSLALATNSGTIVADRTDVAEVWSNTMDYVPTMSELPEECSVVDPDKEQDLADARDFGLPNLV